MTAEHTMERDSARQPDEPSAAAGAIARTDHANSPGIAADERGMTMLELLTALLILSMVSIILYAFLFMGVSMYEKVTAETHIRNQGDAVVSQVITELKDAVYVMQGASNLEIRYVKRADTIEDYVDEYIMRIDEAETMGETPLYGISVVRADAPDTVLRRFDLTKPYSLAVAATGLPLSQLTVHTGPGGAGTNNQMVDVTLVYRNMKVMPSSQERMENPPFEVRTSIPLFRIG